MSQRYMDYGGRYLAGTRVGRVLSYVRQPHIIAGFVATAVSLAGAWVAGPSLPGLVNIAMGCSALMNMSMSQERATRDMAVHRGGVIDLRPDAGESNEIDVRFSSLRIANSSLERAVFLGACALLLASLGAMSAGPLGGLAGALCVSPDLANTLATRSRWLAVAENRYVLRPRGVATPKAEVPQQR